MNEKAFQDHYADLGSHCYGCGRLNEHGLHIKSYWDGDETVCHFEPKSYHSAFEGYVYGGLLASLVDCHATGSAAAFAFKNAGHEMGTPPDHRFVTASLHVEYLKPIPMCELELRGRAKEIKGRKVVIEIDLYAKGQLCVKGEVVAVEVNDAFIKKIVGATP